MSAIYPVKSSRNAGDPNTKASATGVGAPCGKDTTAAVGESSRPVVELYTFRGFCPKG